MIHIIPHKISEQIPVPQYLIEDANFIYLHGELEKINGYDICSFVTGNKPRKDGIFEVKVHMSEKDDDVIFARLFHWTVRGDRLPRGLVVMYGDEVHMRDAEEKFKNKEHH